MSPVTGTAPSPLPSHSGGGHADQGGNAIAPNAGAGTSFSATLAQAISQSSGGSAHGSHGNAGNGSWVAGGSPSNGHSTTLSIPNEGAHPQHIPIGGAGHGGGHGFQETTLGLRAYRQELIAANIANADTPGYKAVDIDFQEALRIARSVTNSSPLTLSTTASGHVPAQDPPPAPLYALTYHTPFQASVDGNTVEMDVERSKFAENALMYQFSMDRVSGHFKMMVEMFQNLKG